MPSWSDLSLLFSTSTRGKQQQSFTATATTTRSSSLISASSSTSDISSCVVTPPSSIRIRYRDSEGEQQQQQAVSISAHREPIRIRRNNKKNKDKLPRERATKQPKPISPRLSSLFFPTTNITTEQEEACIYRATYAVSCSDLLSSSTTRRRTGEGFRWEEEGATYGIRIQDNTSSLDLVDLHSDDQRLLGVPYPQNQNQYLYSQSVDNLLDTSFDLGSTPCLNLEPLRERSESTKKSYRKSVDYSTMSLRTERSSSISGLAGIARGTEIWSSPYDSELDAKPSPPKAQMLPPPIPTRSALRGSVSTSDLRDSARRALGTSSAFKLPVDAPGVPVLSPSTSSRSSSADHQQQPITPPIVSSPSTESTFTLGRKKRPGVANRTSMTGDSRDPNKVRDGAAARESTSGVYTPPTFPGPQGVQSSRPVNPPSRVYTPSTFALNSPSLSRPSTLPLSSPSRSASASSSSTISSTGEECVPRTPRTPLTPSSRFLGAVSGGWGSAVTGIKRASATLTTRSTSSTSPSAFTYTPTSARESYFSNTIYEDSHCTTPGASSSGAGSALAPSFWPGTPGTNNNGLGLGLGEDVSHGLGQGEYPASARRSRTESVGSDRYGSTVLVGDVPKGKRKPVPQAQPGIKEVAEEENVDEEEGAVHAI